MRAWYLRRAIPWVALLGCCAVGVVAALLLARWPIMEEGMLPVLLGACAAATGFVFDEPLPALAEVTPRGAGWRRTTRLSAVAVPGAVWASVLWWRPGQVPADTSGWWLAGTASLVLLAGVAALGSRRGHRAPGPALAAAVAAATFAPLVVSIMLGWVLVYPLGSLTGTIVGFWIAVAALGALALGLALRRGL